MIGNEILNPPDMSSGVVVNPNFEPLDLQLMKMEKKLKPAPSSFKLKPCRISTFSKDLLKKPKN
jgi:hypothetical protein